MSTGTGLKYETYCMRTKHAYTINYSQTMFQINIFRLKIIFNLIVPFEVFKDEAKRRLIWKIFLYGWKISKIGKSIRFLSVSWLRRSSVTGYGLRSQWIWRGKWNMHWPVKMFPFLVLGFPTTDRFIWSDASRESSRKLDAFLKAAWYINLVR